MNNLSSNWRFIPKNLQFSRKNCKLHIESFEPVSISLSPKRDPHFSYLSKKNFHPSISMYSYWSWKIVLLSHTMNWTNGNTFPSANCRVTKQIQSGYSNLTAFAWNEIYMILKSVELIEPAEESIDNRFFFGVKKYNRNPLQR